MMESRGWVGGAERGPGTERVAFNAALNKSLWRTEIPVPPRPIFVFIIFKAIFKNVSVKSCT